VREGIGGEREGRGGEREGREGKERGGRGKGGEGSGKGGEGKGRGGEGIKEKRSGGDDVEFYHLLLSNLTTARHLFFTILKLLHK